MMIFKLFCGMKLCPSWLEFVTVMRRYTNSESESAVFGSPKLCLIEFAKVNRVIVTSQPSHSNWVCEGRNSCACAVIALEDKPTAAAKRNIALRTPLCLENALLMK